MNRLLMAAAVGALALNVAPSVRAQSCTMNETVSNDFVVRYLRALAARRADIRRLAAQNTPEGRYFAATLRRDSLVPRYARFQRHVGPDWAHYQQLTSQSNMTTDAQANTRRYMEAQRFLDGIDPSKVQVPDGGWDAVQAANNRIDVVGREAAQFEVCNWKTVTDIIPSVVEAIARDRRENKTPRSSTEIVIGANRGLRDDELRAIRGHAAELAAALGIDYPSDEDLAEVARAAAGQQSQNDAMLAWQQCRQRVVGAPPTAAQAQAQAAAATPSPDSLRALQSKIEDARRRGDNQALMAIAMQMRGAQTPGQGAMLELRAQQQCGAMPGTTQR